MKISREGRVTIPKKLREQFGLLPNTEVEFVPHDDQLFLVCKCNEQAKAIRAMRGKKKIGMTTDQLMTLLRGTG